MTANKHYLLTLPIDGGYLHSYVISDDHRQLERTINYMIGQAEKAGPVLIPLAMATCLDPNGTKQVTTFLRKHFPQVGPTLKKVKNFHCTTWATPESGPGVDWLMKLH